MRNEEVIEFAQKLMDSEVRKIYTGHGTGKHAYDILSGMLGSCINMLECGMKIVL